jgi:hypothetical protein
MYIYIIQFFFAPFFLKCLSKAVYEMKFLWKKASPFSPKSSQNGENSTADNLTMTDRNGKVRIYSRSSWLKLSYHIGVYTVSIESWNQLVTEFLNPLYVLYILWIPFVWNPQIDIFPKTDFSRNLPGNWLIVARHTARRHASSRPTELAGSRSLSKKNF